MNAPPVRGWCPSLHRPMAARDGLIARVKPCARGLRAADLRRIAEAAQACGSGRIELAGRAAFQVRGLSEATAGRFAAAMVDAGLASADPDAEARRNVQLDPRASGVIRGWGQALERWLEAEADALAALPSKFGFALSRDGDASADVTIVGESPPTVRIAGSNLASPSEEPVAAAQGLTRAFLALAERQAPAPRRMQALVDRIGAAPLFAAAGLAAEPAPVVTPGVPRVGANGDAFVLGVAFGAADVSLLRQVAGLAERFGDGRLALGRGRTLHLYGVAPMAAPLIEDEAARAGFIVRPHDPRLRLHACVGAPGCERTRADVRADALALADRAPAAGLHVSGCAKGCAHPGPAAVTLVAASDGRGYRLLRHRTAADLPTGRPLTLAEAMRVLAT